MCLRRQRQASAHIPIGSAAGQPSPKSGARKPEKDRPAAKDTSDDLFLANRIYLLPDVAENVEVRFSALHGNKAKRVKVANEQAMKLAKATDQPPPVAPAAVAAGGKPPSQATAAAAPAPLPARSAAAEAPPAQGAAAAKGPAAKISPPAAAAAAASKGDAAAGPNPSGNGSGEGEELRPYTEATSIIKTAKQQTHARVFANPSSPAPSDLSRDMAEVVHGVSDVLKMSDPGGKVAAAAGEAAAGIAEKYYDGLALGQAFGAAFGAVGTGATAPVGSTVRSEAPTITIADAVGASPAAGMSAAVTEPLVAAPNAVTAAPPAASLPAMPELVDDDSEGEGDDEEEDRDVSAASTELVDDEAVSAQYDA